MGILIMEKKEWLSNYDQIKATADAAELTFKREQAAHASDLAEAKKREDALKKALGVEKECLANVGYDFNDCIGLKCSYYKFGPYSFEICRLKRLCMRCEQNLQRLKLLLIVSWQKHKV